MFEFFIVCLVAFFIGYGWGLLNMIDKIFKVLENQEEETNENQN